MTPIQRAQSIANGVLGRTASAAEVNRIGRAMAASALTLEQYDNASTADRAEFLVNELRRRVLSLVKEFESQEAVNAARTAAHKNIDDEFGSTP